MINEFLNYCSLGNLQEISNRLEKNGTEFIRAALKEYPQICCNELLYCAVDRGDVDLVQLLLQFDKSNDSLSFWDDTVANKFHLPHYDLLRYDSFHIELLELAIRNHDVSMLKTMFYECDVMPNNITLEWIVINGYLDIFLLLEFEFDHNLNEIMSNLIPQEAHLGANMSTGYFLLELALENEQYEMANRLLDFEAVRSSHPEWIEKTRNEIFHELSEQYIGLKKYLSEKGEGLQQELLGIAYLYKSLSEQPLLGYLPLHLLQAHVSPNLPSMQSRNPVQYLEKREPDQNLEVIRGQVNEFTLDQINKSSIQEMHNLSYKSNN